jgi:hypothetical protein
VIDFGGQAAVVVPVTDFLRLRASAEEPKDAEDAVAPIPVILRASKPHDVTQSQELGRVATGKSFRSTAQTSIAGAARP